ncbi:hypothetical protein P3S68_030584 [Capsicum galapagoense]
MAIKFNSILVVIVTVLLHVSTARNIWKEAPQPIAGGWKTITNITDEVIEIGKFAVDEHNKEADTFLEFQNVINGASQVVEGINYRLTITAMEENMSHLYLAKVWVKPEGTSKNLTYFEKCKEYNRMTVCTYN